MSERTIHHVTFSRIELRRDGPQSISADGRWMKANNLAAYAIGTLAMGESASVSVEVRLADDEYNQLAELGAVIGRRFHRELAAGLVAE